MPNPRQKNFRINQGCTASEIIEIPQDFIDLEIPFVDCLADCQMRESWIQDDYYSLSAYLYEESDGSWYVQLYADAIDTTLMPPKRYRYDVNVSFINEVGNTEVHRVVEGIVEVTPRYTVLGDE